MEHHQGFIFILFAISVEETFQINQMAGMRTCNCLRLGRKRPCSGFKTPPGVVAIQTYAFHLISFPMPGLCRLHGWLRLSIVLWCFPSHWTRFLILKTCKNLFNNYPPCIATSPSVFNSNSPFFSWEFSLYATSLLYLTVEHRSKSSFW